MLNMNICIYSTEPIKAASEALLQLSQGFTSTDTIPSVTQATSQSSVTGR